MPLTSEPAPPTTAPPAATTTASPFAPPPQQSSASPARLASVDALRGVVMFTMLFVNDVAGVRGAPPWMKHYPADANGMTFVDWVFGGFLFIVGLSIPLAFQRRLARGQTSPRLVLHVLARTAGLLLLGVFMVNAERRPAPAGWPAHLWEACVYLFAILAFLAPTARSSAARAATLALRLAAFAGFLLLAAVFRDADGGGMRTSWWGILGLIGWAYLIASLLYLLLRGRIAWMLAAVAALIALNLVDRRGAFAAIPLDRYVDIGSMLGSHAAITMSGVVLGSILLTRPADAVRFAIAFGIALALAAALAYPLHGINKNAATPAWCLICAAVTCWLWAAISFAVDGRGVVRPFAFFIRGGRHALLAYLLMPLLLHVLWMTGLGFYDRLGATPATGIPRAFLAAALVFCFAAFLGARGVRLRL